MSSVTSKIEEISITVVGHDEKWCFHVPQNGKLEILFNQLEKITGGQSTISYLHIHSLPHSSLPPHLSSLITGKCFLSYDNISGRHLLDRNKTVSSYGMVYDDVVHLRGIIKTSDDS